MANNRTSLGREALSGGDIYYGRLLDFFDAVGEFNEIRGIYEKLDQIMNGEWVPPNVLNTFNKTYSGSEKAVRDVYQQRDGRITRLLDYVGEALKVLRLEYTEEDLAEFEMMARGTLGETKFRTSVRRHVETKRNQLSREMLRRINGEKPHQIEIETPAMLIEWYRKQRLKAKARASK